MDVVPIHDFVTKGLILSRPSDKNPTTLFPMTEYVDWEDLFDFVGRVEVVVKMVNVDDNVGAAMPYINSDRQNPRVIFPARKNRADNSVGWGAIVLRIQMLSSHFEHDSFRSVIPQDLISYVGKAAYGRHAPGFGVCTEGWCIFDVFECRNLKMEMRTRVR